ALQTYTIQRGEIRSTVETNGKLEALTTADLAFKSGGRLTRILVHEGDQVPAGTALAELDTDTLARQLKQAQTDLAIANLKLQQAKEGPRPQEIAQAQSDLDAALAALAAAK